MPLTPPLALFCLFVVAALSFYVVRKDHIEYRAFKAATDSLRRRQFFAIWTVRSALGFGATSLALLAWTGRASTLRTLPDEFRSVREALLAHAPLPHGGDYVANWSYLAGFALGLIVPLAGVFVFWFVKRRNVAPRPKNLLIGDIEALLPRNISEGLWAVGISLNAGVSEELFFRLLLPTLVCSVVADPWIAFAVSAAAFGAMHAYQGLAGALAATFLGALLSIVYLCTGELWIAIALHVALDLRTLVLMPSLDALLRRHAAIAPSRKLG